MANPIKQMINVQDPQKILSPEWIDREPVLSDFNLEDKDINTIFREQRRFINSQQIRINSLEKQRPEKVKTKFLPEKTTETYITLIFFVITVCYAVFAWKHINIIILSGLISATLLSFVLYFIKVNAKDKAYNSEVSRIENGIQEILSEIGPFQEDYDNLEKYGEAMYDYENWKKRKDPNYWKSAQKNDIVNAIVSMNRIYDIDSTAVNDGYISLTYENTHGRDFAMYLSHKGALTKNDVDKFREQSYENNLHAGTIIAFKGVQAEAKAECKEEDIQLWTVDNLVTLATRIEAYATEAQDN